MKTIQLSILGILVSFSLFAQQREQRDIRSFNAVNFEGRGELVLIRANMPGIEIEAKEGVDLSKLETYVRNSTLHIAYDRDENDLFDNIIIEEAREKQLV